MAVQRIIDGEDPDEWYQRRCEEYTLAREQVRMATVSQTVREVANFLNACPVCGEGDCQEDLAWVDNHAIHASQHPENKGFFR